MPEAPNDPDGALATPAGASETIYGDRLPANLAGSYAILWFGINGVSLIAMLAQPRTFFEFVARTYWINTLLLPVIAVVPASVGVVLWRRRMRRTVRWGILACCAALVLPPAVRVYATRIEPHRLQVRTVQATLPDLARPVRILHISDIQSAGVGPYEARAVEVMRSLDPDLILFTGDLLQPVAPATYRKELPKIGQLMASLEAPLGKFAVAGDVDPPIVLMAYKDWGFTMLDGESTTVRDGELTIELMGLSSPSSRGGRRTADQLKSWLSDSETDVPRVVMGHSPDFVLDARGLPIDLCLAGHTHGGQVRLPLIGPLITLSRLPREWARGFHEIGRTRLNVSAGIGAEHLADLPSIRFLCPPEMTLIELTPGVDSLP